MSYPLSSGLYAASLLLGGALMLVGGLRYVFDQRGTARTFGVPPAVSAALPSAGDFYMTIAGIRVLELGGIITAFALLEDARATGIAVLGATVVPILDGIAVVWCSDDKNKIVIAAINHWAPAVLSGWLGYALLS